MINTGAPVVQKPKKKKGMTKLYPGDQGFYGLYDASFRPDRDAKKALERSRKWDVGPRLSDPSRDQENEDLFAEWPIENELLGIFNIMNLPFFQNLIWRLRCHEHFETLECFKTFKMSVLRHLQEAAERGVHGCSPYEAPRIVDLLNNIDRYGGWNQTTAL